MEKSLTHRTKMGADRLAKNTPNHLKIFSPKCLTKTKSFGFKKKRSLRVYVVVTWIRHEHNVHTYCIDYKILIQTWSSPSVSTFFPISGFSSFVIRFLNHTFSVVNFTYFIIRFYYRAIK